MPSFGAGPNAGLNIARIQEMRLQGLSNNQIIQTLQRDGFSSKDIFEALNQTANQLATPGPAAPSQFSGPAQPLNSPLPDAPGMVPPMPLPPPLAGAPAAGISDEELIEAIIDEKWNDLLEDINKIVAWKDRTAQQLASFEQQLKDLKEQFDKLHQAVIGKVGEYDQHILQVGAEVKAMEKVFSKVLPVFTENVAELSRVADVIGQATLGVQKK